MCSQKPFFVTALPAGLSARAVPAGVATFHSNPLLGSPPISGQKNNPWKHEEQAAFQETEQFKELARNRYKIEAKNSELKNPHGYDTARSTGLFGMGIQAATTIFAVNLKRIIKLMNEKE